jgi:DinB superfamily
VELSDLRFPIGKLVYDGPSSEIQRQKLISEIEHAPAALRAAVTGLSPEQLDTPYRDGGWTVRQVVHHLPDSHMNAYVRFKLALTENEPVIKPYEQQLWAELPDNRNTPIDTSLVLLESLHVRFANLLHAIQPDQWKRTFRHPELGVITLDKNLAIYAWHGRHHVAHITELRKRMGW